MAKRCQNYDFYFNESSILQSRRSRPISRLKIGIQHLLDAYMLPYQLDLSELKSSFRPFVAFGAFLRPLDPIFWIENFQLIIVLMGAAFIYATISSISRYKNCIPGVQFRTLCSKIKHSAQVHFGCNLICTHLKKLTIFAHFSLFKINFILHPSGKKFCFQDVPANYFGNGTRMIKSAEETIKVPAL